MQERIHTWLQRFDLDAFLFAHTAKVLTALPPQVLQDLMDDPSFLICDFEPGPGHVAAVPVGVPRAGEASRSVVFKRTLRQRPTSFVRWLIAHELAHAHLRNQGRFPGDDPEQAADALAAAWGFPRPQT